MIVSKHAKLIVHRIQSIEEFYSVAKPTIAIAGNMIHVHVIEITMHGTNMLWTLTATKNLCTRW